MSFLVSMLFGAQAPEAKPEKTKPVETATLMGGAKPATSTWGDLCDDDVETGEAVQAHSLTEAHRRALVGKLRTQFGKLTFRRVRTVQTVGRVEMVHFTNDAMSKPVRGNPDERSYRQNVEVRVHGSFTGKTGAAEVREDTHPRELLFTSAGQRDVDSVTLEMVPWTKKYHIPPRGPQPARDGLPVMSADLICGHVKDGVFTEWWICSEQFLHMATLILHPEHAAFQCKNEADVRKKAFKGNHTVTAGWRRWSIPRVARKMPITAENETERYWRLRTETPSQERCHIYAAVVLLTRYAELPSHTNVPRLLPGPNQSADDVVNFTEWDLPKGYVWKFLMHHLPRTMHYDVKGILNVPQPHNAEIPE